MEDRMRTLSLALAVFSIVVSLTAPAALAGPKDCPPGLAKKNSACLPPGQAKKIYGYRVGDRIERDYVVLTNPYRYGLDARGTYWRVGDSVFQVNRQTGEILAVIGALSNLMN
jgi:hypothetical protein